MIPLLVISLLSIYDSLNGVFWRTEVLNFYGVLFITDPVCAILKKFLLQDIQALEDII